MPEEKIAGVWDFLDNLLTRKTALTLCLLLFVTGVFAGVLYFIDKQSAPGTPVSIFGLITYNKVGPANTPQLPTPTKGEVEKAACPAVADCSILTKELENTKNEKTELDKKIADLLKKQGTVKDEKTQTPAKSASATQPCEVDLLTHKTVLADLQSCKNQASSPPVAKPPAIYVYDVRAIVSTLGIVVSDCSLRMLGALSLFQNAPPPQRMDTGAIVTSGSYRIFAQCAPPAIVVSGPDLAEADRLAHQVSSYLIQK